MRLMIVGHLDGQLGAASNMAAARGASVAHCRDIAQALRHLCEGKGADLVMVDVQEDIAGFVHDVRAQRMAVPIVACGVAHNKEAAVRAIQAGAKEYIPLPPEEELIAAVLEAISDDSSTLLYQSPAMARVLQMVGQVAASDASVLITGESGTGKEVIARHLHQHSQRADKPFISVNCAAIPENLLESELFGHEKGAFTGALHKRLGKFEEAHKGTLLLDEISEMDMKLQAKLLRALQEREFDRVGGNKPIKVDIRILATSNCDMLARIREGKFREDLYYRLNVIHVQLPTLRERGDDVLLLAEHFIHTYAQANHLAPLPLTSEARAKLRRYPWPGNVRELENTMHRAVLMATGDAIDAAAIMLPAHATPGSSDAGGAAEDAEAQDGARDGDEDDAAAPISGLVGCTVAEVERELILKTLDHCLGNRTHAANILGISIRTLRNKLRLYEDTHPSRGEVTASNLR